MKALGSVLVCLCLLRKSRSPPEQHPAALLRVSLLVVEVVTVESAELRQIVPGIQSTGAQGPGSSHQVHWQARKTYRSYSIPLGYKDLLVVQLAVGDFPLAEKWRERILPVFQEG